MGRADVAFADADANGLPITTIGGTANGPALTAEANPVELPQGNPIVASMLDSKLRRPVETKAMAKPQTKPRKERDNVLLWC